MAKKVTAQVKLQIPAGKATPAPPVGTALGPQGVNIMEFCKAFNAKTSGKDQEGLIIPVVITIFSDRSFTFITKTPPVPVLIKRAVNLAKGSAEPNKNKVGKITAEAGRRDRQDQDARSELLRPRSRHEQREGHRRAAWASTSSSRSPPDKYSTLPSSPEGSSAATRRSGHCFVASHRQHRTISRASAVAAAIR